MDYRYFNLLAVCIQIPSQPEADVTSAVQMLLWGCGVIFCLHYSSLLWSQCWLKHFLFQHTSDSCYGCSLPAPISACLFWESTSMSKSKSHWDWRMKPYQDPDSVCIQSCLHSSGFQVQWKTPKTPVSEGASPFCSPAPRNILTYCQNLCSASHALFSTAPLHSISVCPCGRRKTVDFLFSMKI